MESPNPGSKEALAYLAGLAVRPLTPGCFPPSSPPSSSSTLSLPSFSKIHENLTNESFAVLACKVNFNFGKFMCFCSSELICTYFLCQLCYIL